jgi:hypothetical protein
VSAELQALPSPAVDEDLAGHSSGKAGAAEIPARRRDASSHPVEIPRSTNPTQR